MVLTAETPGPQDLTTQQILEVQRHSRTVIRRALAKAAYIAFPVAGLLEVVFRLYPTQKPSFGFLAPLALLIGALYVLGKTREQTDLVRLERKALADRYRQGKFDGILVVRRMERRWHRTLRYSLLLVFGLVGCVGLAVALVAIDTISEPGALPAVVLAVMALSAAFPFWKLRKAKPPNQFVPLVGSPRPPARP